MLCAFAFIVISGLMVLVKCSELKDAEKRERHILEVNNQIHNIKTTRREIEEIQREATQLLQEIIDRQAHYETADHHHPHAEQQLADLAQQRKQVEELLRRSERNLAISNQQLAKCEQMLRNVTD